MKHLAILLLAASPALAEESSVTRVDMTPEIEEVVHEAMHRLTKTKDFSLSEMSASQGETVINVCGIASVNSGRMLTLGNEPFLVFYRIDLPHLNFPTLGHLSQRERVIKTCADRGDLLPENLPPS